MDQGTYNLPRQLWIKPARPIRSYREIRRVRPGTDFPYWLHPGYAGAGIGR